MLRKLRQILLGEKGQSMTEWALVALFVVGLVYMFRESSLLPQLSNAYDSVGSYLSSTTLKNPIKEAIDKYGTLSNTELKQVDNAQRISLDASTLRTLAGAFLGKTQSELKTMFINTPRFTSYDPNGELNQGNLLFDYNIKNTGENGTVKTEFSGDMVSKDNLLNWMQGDYTILNSQQKTLSSDNRYFFSNDLIDNHGIDGNTVQNTENWAVSVRCAFEFDQEGKVSAVQIWATRNKKDTSLGGSGWLRHETAGVDGKMNIRVTN